jgi:protein ImuB
MALPLSLPLFPEPSPPSRPPLLRILPQRLWMAVQFPRLLLEALGIPPADQTALALTEGEGRIARVCELTQGAARLGIRIGQSPAAALALVPGLRLKPREPARERGALLKLAAAGQHFTPTVSLEAPAALLLEIAGSAHLFGGEVAIRERAGRHFAAEGFSTRVAVAGTPLAALWLAQAGEEITVAGLDELRSVLGRLPVQTLFATSDLHDAFQRLGIRHLAELLRLPRDGLAKRFGAEFLLTLDRAMGLLPDPREAWEAPPRCRAFRELPGEFTSLDHLRPYIGELLAELCRSLRAYDAGTDKLGLVFRHWRRPPTVLTVGSALPCRDPDRWEELLEAQLANLRLEAPVHELQLLSGRLQAFLAPNRDLLPDRQGESAPFAALVDLLRARLGRQSVSGLAVTAEARPERAFRITEPGTSSPLPRAMPPRPIHLLNLPLPLLYKDGCLRHQGTTLKLTRGPERIEGGWWEGEAWHRDYYEALSAQGERLWVFQQDGAWCLHGMFS